MTAQDRPGPLAGTVIRGAGLAGSGWALAQMLNLGIYLVLARLATPEDFGEFAAGAVLTGIGATVAGSGMVAALIQRRDRVEEAANTALVATVSGGVALSLLALALSPLVGHFFQDDRVGVVAAAMSGWIAVRAAASVPGAVLQRRFSFLRRVVVDPLSVIAWGATSIPLAAEGMGAWALVLGNYAQAATILTSSWLLVRWRPRLGLASFSMWRELAGFGRHVLSSEVVRRAFALSGTALIGRILGTPGLGQYTYASRIGTQPQVAVVNAGSYVLFPAFARLSDDADRFRRAFTRAVRWISVLATPLSLALLPLGVPLMVLVFGDQWREAGYGVMGLCAYTAARSLVSLCEEASKAAARPDILPRMQLVTGIATIASLAALLPFGVAGAGAALSLGAIAAAAYSLRAVAPVVGVATNRLVGEIVAPTAGAVMMAAVVLALDRLLIEASERPLATGLALLAGEAALCIPAYLAGLAVLSPARAREVIELRHAVVHRLRRRG